MPFSSAAPSAPSGLSPCAQIVHDHDRERFLTILLVPDERREELYALHALNHELARTREVAREPLLGAIRLQWWQDGINALFEEGTPAPHGNHPVLQALAKSHARQPFDRALLERLLTARDQDLDDTPPPTPDALRDYASATGGSLVRLGLGRLGVADATAHRAADHAGTAWALIGLLRAVPFHAAQQRIYLPADRLAAHAVRVDSLFAGRPDPGLPAVVHEISALAGEQITAARRYRHTIPRSARPVLLPAALAALYQRVIRRHGGDVFAPRVALPHPARLAWLLLHQWLGRY